MNLLDSLTLSQGVSWIIWRSNHRLNLLMRLSSHRNQSSADLLSTFCVICEWPLTICQSKCSFLLFSSGNIRPWSQHYGFEMTRRTIENLKSLSLPIYSLVFPQNISIWGWGILHSTFLSNKLSINLTT